MNIDVKLEAEKIASEIVNGTVEQACYDYENILGNYHFLTSSRIEKSFLNNLGTNIAKHVRKNPENFIQFCENIWYKKVKDGRPSIGLVLAALESINPEGIIEKIVEMCETAAGIDDVDTLVTGFEPVILKNPDEYLPMLKEFIKRDNIWIKRLVIVTVGHLMFRYKTKEITSKCLEIIRSEISNSDENVRKATSWIIGSYAVRADQEAVVEFIQSFSDSENIFVVKTFAEAFRRSKITLQSNISAGLVPMFEKWSKSEDSGISKSSTTVLKTLRK